MPLQVRYMYTCRSRGGRRSRATPAPAAGHAYCSCWKLPLYMYPDTRRSSIAASSHASSACAPMVISRAPRLTALRRKPLPLYRGPLHLGPCLYVAPQAFSPYRKPLYLIQVFKTRRELPKRVPNRYNAHESTPQASVLAGAMGCSYCQESHTLRHKARRGARQHEKQDRA